MRFAAYGMCGDVTATTVPADPALIRTWPVTVIGGLADRPAATRGTTTPAPA